MMWHLILSNNSDRLRAFSLPELLVVVVVTTVVGAASYPVINNLSGASSYAEAKAKAEALTVAKIRFRKSDEAADSNWSSAGNDLEKFQLLLPYLKGVTPALTLADYSTDPPYDQFLFGTELHARVTVNGLD